jgi:hypothetical protein
MKRAPPVSSFSRRSGSGRTALAGLVLLCLVAASGPSPAQDAGVSGIAPGPGNVNGLNGSVRDPSGIGNAARMPALPQQATPVSPPAVSVPNTSYQTYSSQRVVRVKRTRYARHKLSPAAEKAAVRENDRLLDHKLTSICRGC